MQTSAFLRLIFPVRDDQPERNNELLRFAVVDQGVKFPGTVHWKSRSELTQLNETGIAALGFNTVGKDVYFTPHGFTRRGIDVQKEDTVPLIDVVWVELDDGDIPPETFNPAPSIIVNTSPNRYHLYWLLDKGYPAEEVERINYRMVYGHNLREDKGGWARTKWLRLPGSSSYKREVPFNITVTQDHSHLIYTLDDFSDLPEVGDMLFVNEALPDPPNPDNLPTAEEIADRYSLPRELEDLLNREKKDRSAALWRMYHLCYYAGITQEECFVLVRNSPNDKFHASWRYSADEDLWKDIYRGYRMAHTPDETPILAEIKQIRAAKNTPKPERRRAIAQLIVKDLMRTGRIYFHEEQREALYYNGRHIITMEPTNSRWKTLLNMRYWVTEGEEDFKPVNANISAIAEVQGERIVPHSTSYWDKQMKILYIYNGEGKMYRLDGETIEFVDNGSDGVLFRDRGVDQPFIANADPADADGEIPPTLSEAIFGLPNYEVAVNKHTRDQAITMFRMWAYGLFFSEEMDARPHLIITGPTDSGKSLAFQGLLQLLSGSEATVTSVPTDSPTFQTLVSNAHHVFLDNVDTPNNWLTDALCEVATGIEFTRRMYYTTNESVTYRVKCNIGMTTRNTWFSRADVANRSIVLHVERRDMKTSPTVLLDRIRKFRGHLWHELLTDLNKIIIELKSYRPGNHKLRMAAYADFVLAACRALNIESRGLLELIEGNQRESALNNSPLWSVLDTWIRQPGRDDVTQQPTLKNNGQRVTVNRLHAELRFIAGDQGNQREYERQIGSSRALAQQLRELIPDIRRFMEVDIIKSGASNQYVFTLPSTPEGAYAPNFAV
jgi:hypothetical protein